MEKAQAPRYHTLRSRGEAEFTEKKSRFLGIAVPVFTQQEAQRFIEDVRERYPDASSICYGYRCGPGGSLQRYHDDHEPSGGQPILDVLVKQDLAAAAAVVRWFGGVKLGAGPLGRAFGRAAALAVAEAGTCRADLSRRLIVETGYGESGSVEYYLKHSLCRLEGAQYAQDVTFRVLIRDEAVSALMDRVADMTAGRGRCRIVDSTYICWD